MIEGIDSRFLPGTLVAGRYRIVSLLGRGGMGEVYRADDLRLGQPVALKFLPENLETDESLRARFLGEVRIARQITHPNVCRMYDIVDVDGCAFASMEYVDGEDLSQLLRRIGRLPAAKALEVARQITAGLLAAHELNVLHRDLKPANIMIDGRGRARVMDFGLAVPGGRMARRDAMVGTPAYMAPELLEGDAATKRSDVYALGLVLYEVFAGKPAFAGGSAEAGSTQGDTRAGGVLERLSTPPPSPRTHVPDIDPAVDQLIMRCLQQDPNQRPSSAREVAAALPGSALATAIAAGETPSPETVAEAGGKGALRPALAGLALMALLVLLAATVALQARGQLTERLHIDRSPELMRARAREVLAHLGAQGPAHDAVGGWLPSMNYLQYRDTLRRGPGDWSWLSGPQGRYALYYWYRESPRVLRQVESWSWSPNYYDPPLDVSGMTSVLLDPGGRLLGIKCVPPEYVDSARAAPDPDWGALFAEAGLRRDSFRPVAPQWTHVTFADRRAAWVGVDSLSGMPLRIEAASYMGKPVSVRWIEPWSHPTPASGRRLSVVEGWVAVVIVLAAFGFLIGGVLLARSNVRAQRSDTAGALRLGVAAQALQTASWLCLAHHVPEVGEAVMVFLFLGSSLFLSGLLAIWYLALEPFLRRMWPERMIAWVRALDGRWRDPRVGRDVLLGSVAGAATSALTAWGQVLPSWLHMRPPRPEDPSRILAGLGGVSSVVGRVPDTLYQTLTVTLGFMLLFLILLIMFRKRLVAQILLGVVLAVPVVVGGHSALGIVIDLVSLTLTILVLLRLGPLAVLAMVFVSGWIDATPAALDPSSWRFGYALFGIAVTVGIGVYGWLVSMGGAPVFGIRDDTLFAPSRAST